MFPASLHLGYPACLRSPSCFLHLSLHLSLLTSCPFALALRWPPAIDSLPIELYLSSRVRFLVLVFPLTHLPAHLLVHSFDFSTLPYIRLFSTCFLSWLSSTLLPLTVTLTAKTSYRHPSIHPSLVHVRSLPMYPENASGHTFQLADDSYQWWT